jgi:hypothetical protein
MDSFKAAGSDGLRFIESLCPGHNLTRESLIVLAKAFSWISGVHFPRDYTRRRDLVIKWFDNHVDALEPLGRLFHLEAITLHNNLGGDTPAESNLSAPALAENDRD